MTASFKRKDWCRCCYLPGLSLTPLYRGVSTRISKRPMLGRELCLIPAICLHLRCAPELDSQKNQRGLSKGDHGWPSS